VTRTSAKKDLMKNLIMTSLKTINKDSPPDQQEIFIVFYRTENLAGQAFQKSTKAD